MNDIFSEKLRNTSLGKINDLGLNSNSIN